MSYLGKVALKASDIRRLDVTSSTSATHTLTWTPPNEQSLIITINGVKQQNNYTISGTTLTLDTALVATDEMEVIGINDIGTTTVPGDDTVTTDKIQDDAVTADKLANSINTEIAANTAKVTNATHTGDVTGATALTIASGAVDLAMLSATGTADATTFLRGDNAWAEAGGGKVLQVVASTIAVETRTKSTTFTGTGLSATLTPAATSSKILILVNGGSIVTGAWNYDSFTALYSDIGGAGASKIADIGANFYGSSGTFEGGSQSMNYLYSPNTTSAVVIEPYYKSSSSSYWAYFTAGGGYTVSLVLMEIGA